MIRSVLSKPPAVSGREHEWRALARFAAMPDDGARLGIVYGRRRQGKTYLLDQLADVSGGFLFTAAQQSSVQNLAALGGAYSGYLGLEAPVRFQSWSAAVEALLRLGEARPEPTIVVIDEFPYLLDEAPELPSLIQAAIGPGSRSSTSGRTRLILCGSALTSMRSLLTGTAPLRGRASLEMVLQPFDYRESAEFWGLATDPDTAFHVNALVGGTPAYREMSGGSPSSTGLAEWVVDGLLDPASAMFREGNVLLYEQPGLIDPGLYFSVLGAVASGATRRSGIAAALGRPSGALAHPLAVLEELQLIERAEDALRATRPVYRVAEPIIRLSQLVIRPREARLVARQGRQIWEEAADTVSARIYGPHLEALAREWTSLHARHLGGAVSIASASTLRCRNHPGGHELDIVAIENLPNRKPRILAIGEAKATKRQIGVDEIARLEHIRTLLPPENTSEAPTLLLFAKSGFTEGASAEARSREDVQLVGLDRLYNGD